MFPNASNFKNHDDLIVRESLGQAILGVNFGDAEIFATQFVPEVQTLPDGRLCIIRFIRQKRIGQIEFDARRQSQFRNILAGGRAFVALVPADTQMQVTGMTEFGS
jgi:AraC-like DNA-binding protein